MTKKYDSTQDTLDHIGLVQKGIDTFCDIMRRRATRHDQSKLEYPEKAAFDEYTPKLAGLTYGSPEYKATLDLLRPALEHHYRQNSHHPEHYTNGVGGFNLMDLVEMFFDWNAATKRHNDGDLRKSIQINKNRFNLSDQIVSIFHNTANRLGL